MAAARLQLVALVLAAACGNSSMSVTPIDAPLEPDAAAGPDAATTSGTPDAAVRPDGALIPDAAPGPDAGAADAAPAVAGGSVVITQTPGNQASYTVSATFAFSGNGCTSSPVGACRTFVCTPGSSPTLVSAGTVTVSGGELAPVVMSPDGTNAYTNAFAAGLAYSPGESLRFQGSGGGQGGVPAFDEMVTAPSQVTVTSPVLPMGMPLHVDTSMDFTVAWTAGQSPEGQVEILLTEATSPADPAHIVSCRVAVDASQFTVPASVMQTLGAGPGTIAVQTGNPKEIDVGLGSLELDVRYALVAGVVLDM
jgi:hypothetical protein